MDASSARSVTSHGVAGVALFLLTLTDYYLWNVEWLRPLCGCIEVPGAFLIVALVASLDARRPYVGGSAHGPARSMALSLWTGAVWGALSLLYIKFLNPGYPQLMGQRAVPPGAVGAETTLPHAAAEFISSPFVQLVWKIGLCGVCGLIIGLVLAFRWGRAARTKDHTGSAR